MKSRTVGIGVLRHTLWVSFVALWASACGGAPSVGASGPAPQPIAGDIERTTFDPALGVRLDAMTKRASGMYVQDLTPGTGSVATRGRTVVVRYTGWLPS
ncbi:MAG TPA: hypothetical protein VGQ56_15610, partial [Gemmatimonadaceae bacterium]|nr:hypothetical protein [Gemmatimonadaceae bacterium]